MTNWKAPFRCFIPLLSAGGLGVLLLLPLFSFSQFEEEDQRIVNEFIVMLKPTHSVENLLAQIPSVKIKKCLSPRMNIYLLERNTIASSEEFLFTLKQNEHVKLAQFNHRIKQRALIPNDPDFGIQWNMLNTGQGAGIAGADIEATEAWVIDTSNVTACGDTIVIAVIDDMFDLNHEDLNYFVNHNEIPGNSVDDDGNGYIDDVSGWNVFDMNGDVHSTSLFQASHSTHCAGIAAAIGNNGKGVAGVCWGAKILPVAGSSTQESEVVAAYDYVRTMRILYNTTFGTKGAFVVSTNSSFGEDFGNPTAFPIWCAMYDSMGYVGILSAAATANNNSTNVDVQHDVPTECASPWLIAVTNTNRNDLRSGAAYGKISVDLGAPGEGIRSTVPPSSYQNMSGTSMASPHVAGTIAAMYAGACKSLCNKYYEQPDTIALIIKKYILEGAEWVSSMNNITVTNGRLNLLRAITNLKKYNCDSCGFSVDVNTTPIVCKNDSDGTAVLTFSTGTVSDYDIVWSNGLTFSTLQDLTPGFYVATVTDTITGCSRVATAEFHNPDSILINSIITTGADSLNPGNIIVNAKAGNETLLYSIDGITYQTTATFSIPTNGTYTVYVKNSSGCVAQKNVVVSDVEEIGNQNLEIRIFPNPADDALTVYCPQFEKQKTLLEVFDVTGRKIFEAVPQSSIFNLQSSIFASGMYFLKAGNNTQKFSVAH